MHSKNKGQRLAIRCGELTFTLDFEPQEVSLKELVRRSFAFAALDIIKRHEKNSKSMFNKLKIWRTNKNNGTGTDGNAAQKPGVYNRITQRDIDNVTITIRKVKCTKLVDVHLTDNMEINKLWFDKAIKEICLQKVMNTYEMM